MIHIFCFANKTTKNQATDRNAEETTAALQEYQVALQAYRSLLISAEQKSQEDYDKTVIALSGGALGISFAFVKDIVGSQSLATPVWLCAAWIAWGLSVTLVLTSFYFSHLALRKAIKQVDENLESLYNKPPGGFFTRVTQVLNVLDGLLFLIGVAFMVIFVLVSYNIL